MPAFSKSSTPLAIAGWCAALLAMWPQDPPPAPPAPDPAKAKPAAAAPAAPAASPAADAVPGLPPPHPLEGVYALKKRVHAGVEDPAKSRGYVAFTKRHLLLCLVGTGLDPDLPLLRAGVRTWQQQGEMLETVVKLGYFTDDDGGMHLERNGAGERRRLVVMRGLLRIYQDDRSYLEFERIE